MNPTADLSPPSLDPSPLRPSTGRGRPYPADIVAAARELYENEELRCDEIAARIGIGKVTIALWARRLGWRRTGWRCPGAGAAPLSAPRRPRGRYGPDDHASAQARIEGSRDSLETIAVELGISSLTLFRWQKRFGWQRPASPPRPGPSFHRFRSRGRPYASDAVGIVQRLVTQSLLSQEKIAAQAGVSQQTVSDWMRQRGWTRPPVPPGSHRFAAAKRCGPLAETGNRRGRPYARESRRKARTLWELTRLSTALIAARCGVSRETVSLWARKEGWDRPRGRAGVRQLRGFFATQGRFGRR